MNNVKLGELVKDDTGRDAIHIAVIPVVAGQHLHPGAMVSITEGKAYFESDHEKSIGVVDPFLKREWVPAGDKFLLLLNPNTITSLRHEWEHPVFPLAMKPSEDDRYRAEKYLKEAFVNCYWDEEKPEDISKEFENFISEVRNKGFYTFYGTSYQYVVDRPEFWENLSIFLGYPVSRDSVCFNCTC